MFRKNFRLLLVLFLLFNCKEDSIKKINHSLIESDSISVNFNDSIPYFQSGNYWNFDENNFSFLHENEINPSIFRYNFENKNWLKIPLEYQGRNGIIRNGGFSFINDSTFIFTPIGTGRAFIIENKIKKEIEEIKDNYVFLDSKRLVAQWDKNNLIFPIQFSSQLNENYFKESLLVYKSDLSKRKNKFGHFPTDYNKYSFINNIYQSITITSEYIIISFPKSEYIYIYNKRGKYVKKVICKNENFFEIIGNKNTGNKLMKSLENTSAGVYRNLLYDKYRKNYYRLSRYCKKYDGNLNKSNLKEVFNSLILGVTTLNSDFELISYDEFSNVTDTNYLINSNGFYLRSLEEKEQEIKFVKMTLKNEKN